MLCQFKWDFKVLMGGGSVLCEELGVVVKSSGIGAHENLEWTVSRENSTASISIYLQSCGIFNLNGIGRKLMMDQLQWEYRVEMWVGTDDEGMVVGTTGDGTNEDQEWTIWSKNSTASISIYFQSCGIRKLNGKRRNLILCQMQWDHGVVVGREVVGEGDEIVACVVGSGVVESSSL